MIAHELIQESLKNEKLRIAKNRRDEIRRMVDYYTDTETDKYIGEYFSELMDVFEEYKIDMNARGTNV